MNLAIKNIDILSYPIYNPQNEFVGGVNLFEFLDFRIQCKQNKVKGYTLHLPEQIVYIDEKGKLHCLEKTQLKPLKKSVFLDFIKDSHFKLL